MSCGELDTVLPSRGTYSVNALVDTDRTLQEYPILSQSSKIRPYFENSIADDPDVRGLVVFVQNPSGTAVSRKIQYDLKEGKTAVAAEIPAQPPTESAAAATDTANTEKIPANSTEDTSAKTGAGGNSDSLTTGTDAAADSAGSIAENSGEAVQGGDASVIPAGNDAGSVAEGAEKTETPVIEAPPAEKPAPEPQGESSLAGLPLEPQPGPAIVDGLDEGSVLDTGAASRPSENSAVDVSETVTTDNKENTGAVTDVPGGAETTETAAANAAAAASATAAESTAANSSVTTPKKETQKLPDLQIRVDRLDEYLPAFQILEELEIGQYSLVFQVMGERDVLYKTAKSIYFLADAEFSLSEIQSFLPKVSEGNQLVPPGINIMLEAAIEFDSRLDPYVIWYNGKKVIAQGRVSENANHLLWKTPEQTGFQIIRVEAFPLRIDDKLPSNIIGKTKEISLPVSSKYGDMGFFSDTGGNFAYWYQFMGNLNDVKAPNNAAKQLVSQRQKPRWDAFAGSYGLAIGPDDVYTLPGSPFALSDKEEGYGEILFYFVPLKEGTILSAVFDSLTLQVSGNSTELRLRLSSDGAETQEAKLEIPAEASAGNFAGNSGYISGLVAFRITPNLFSAWLSRKHPKLGSSEPAGDSTILTLPLEKPISGRGTVRFGAAGSSRRNTAGETQVAIFNELAVSYTRSAAVIEHEPAALSSQEEESRPESKTGEPEAKPRQELSEDQELNTETQEIADAS